MGQDSRQSYEQWKTAVNHAVIRLTGMDCDDLPDYNYRDAYDAGDTPHQTAGQVVKRAREF